MYDAYPAVEQIEALIHAGTRLADVEEFIDRLPLGADEQDALWLVAWCKTSEKPRRPLASALPRICP